jgi:hypothetical protein
MRNLNTFVMCVAFFVACAMINFVATVVELTSEEGSWLLVALHSFGFMCSAWILACAHPKTAPYVVGILPWVLFTLYGKLHGYKYYVVTVNGNERSLRSYSYVTWTWRANAKQLHCPEYVHVRGPLAKAEADAVADMFNAIG